MSYLDKIQTDIECMAHELEESKTDLTGAVMVAFTKRGDTLIDFACTQEQLASAICSLQAEFLKRYKID